jgi:hypothetical protein
MMHDDEPMGSFDENEWRAYKRAQRHLAYVKRMQQVKEADPRAWLAALERDDKTDPYEERPAPRKAA